MICNQLSEILNIFIGSPSTPGLMFSRFFDDILLVVLKSKSLPTIFLGSLTPTRSFPNLLVTASLNTPVKIEAPWSWGWPNHFFHWKVVRLPCFLKKDKVALACTMVFTNRITCQNSLLTQDCNFLRAPNLFR